MIRASNHRALLDRILTYYGLPVSSLEVVPDVQAWCMANNRPENRAGRAAKCFYDVHGCHIVMRDEQTDDMLRSAKDGMYTHGFEQVYDALDTDLKSLVHLMLHEVACFTLQTSQQEARDEWAFGELSKHAPAA